MRDTVGDAPLGWGGPRELTPFETMMWRADGDPMMRSTMMAVEVLDGAPEWSRLVEAHEWAIRMVPRSRDRVADRLGPFGTPVWVRDRRMDLHYHLRRVRLPVGANLDAAAVTDVALFARCLELSFAEVLHRGQPRGAVTVLT